jgi:hypothetical protein
MTRVFVPLWRACMLYFALALTIAAFGQQSEAHGRARSVSQRLAIQVSPPTVSFLPVVTYPTGPAGITFVSSLASADVNNDGIPDLVIADTACCGTTGAVAVLIGNGDGTFEPALRKLVAGIAETSALAVADVNRDGYPVWARDLPGGEDGPGNGSTQWRKGRVHELVAPRGVHGCKGHLQRQLEHQG